MLFRSEKILGKYVADSTKDIKAELAQTRLEKQREEINKGIDTAFGKYTNSTDLKDEVMKLMDSFKASKDISHVDYFESLLVLAANRKGIELKKVGSTPSKDSTKETKNRNDVGGRLTSERGAEVKLGIRVPQKLSLNDAVNAALEELTKK